MAVNSQYCSRRVALREMRGETRSLEMCLTTALKAVDVLGVREREISRVASNLEVWLRLNLSVVSGWSVLLIHIVNIHERK